MSSGMLDMGQAVGARTRDPVHMLVSIITIAVVLMLLVPAMFRLVRYLSID